MKAARLYQILIRMQTAPYQTAIIALQIATIQLQIA